MAKRFSVYEFLLREGPEEDEQFQQNQTQDPTQNPAMDNQGQEMDQSQTLQPPEVAPNQIKNKVSDQNKTALKDVVGSTISDISYQTSGQNSGKITIKIANSHVPLVLSWVGNKVTAQKPSGAVIILSGEE